MRKCEVDGRMEDENHSCSRERRLEDVERLSVIRKVTCRKLREARQRRVGMVTLSQLGENYRRVRKEVKKA